MNRTTLRESVSRYTRHLSVLAVSAAVTLAALIGTGSPSPTAQAASCQKPRGVVTIYFSARKYPNIRKHALDAIRKGWPSVLVVNRRGADDRRDRLLGPIPTKRGYDRDEYPPAVGRGKGRGLQKGSNPTGWRADVRYVRSKENRSHGSSMGGKLRKFCNGTRFRYGWE